MQQILCNEILAQTGQIELRRGATCCKEKFARFQTIESRFNTLDEISDRKLTSSKAIAVLLGMWRLACAYAKSHSLVKRSALPLAHS